MQSSATLKDTDNYADAINTSRTTPIPDAERPDWLCFPRTEQALAGLLYTTC